MDKEYKAGEECGTRVATGFMKGTMNYRDRKKLAINPYPESAVMSRKSWRAGFNDGYELVMSGYPSMPGIGI